VAFVSVTAATNLRPERLSLEVGRMVPSYEETRETP
jgi:hypothetical protein